MLLLRTLCMVLLLCLTLFIGMTEFAVKIAPGIGIAWVFLTLLKVVVLTVIVVRVVVVAAVVIPVVVVPVVLVVESAATSSATVVKTTALLVTTAAIVVILIFWLVRLIWRPHVYCENFRFGGLRCRCRGWRCIGRKMRLNVRIVISACVGE